MLNFKGLQSEHDRVVRFTGVTAFVLASLLAAGASGQNPATDSRWVQPTAFDARGR
jgi:hypothetical protein